MSVNGYLFAAYTAIWTILFIYLFFLHRKQKEVSRLLESVRQAQSKGSER